jgi:hypothetical protein
MFFSEFTGSKIKAFVEKDIITYIFLCLSVFRKEPKRLELNIFTTWPHSAHRMIDGDHFDGKAFGL